MPSYDTSGFDAVVEISETEIDNVIACKFATGELSLPYSDTFPIAGFQVTTTMLFDTPWVTLLPTLGSRNQPGIEVTLPFDESYLEVGLGGLPFTPPEESVADLRGTLQLSLPVQTASSGTEHEVVLATGSTAAKTIVKFTDETEQRLDQLGETYADQIERQLPDPDETLIDQLRNFSDTVQTHIDDSFTADALGAVSNLGLDVTFEAERSEVQVVGGNSSDERCLLVLAELSPDPPAEHAAVSDGCQRPTGTAALAMASDYLLSTLVCPGLAEGLDLDEDNFEYPCRLSGSPQTTLEVQGKSKSVTVEDLKATVEGDRIVVDGHVSTTEKNADVDVWFTTDINVAFEGGDLSLSITDVDTSSDVDLPWYLDLVGIVPFVGALGIAIAERIIEENVAGSVAGSIRNRDDLTDASRANEMIDNRLNQMDVTNFDFNEQSMVFAGSLLADQHCEPMASGTTVVSPGEGLDLDGSIDVLQTLSVGADRHVDLVLEGRDGAVAFYPENGTKVSVMDRGFWPYELSVLDLEAKADEWWSRNPIDISMFPGMASGANSGLGRQFAVYTSEGRYAKCLGRQRSDGSVWVMYHTYDRPAPGAVLDAERTILNETLLDSGTDIYPLIRCHGGLNIQEVEYEYEDYERSFRIICQIAPSRLARPLSVDWHINDQPVSGTGTRFINGHEVDYEVEGETCTLETEKGNKLNAYVGVDITDNRKLTFNAGHNIRIPAVIRETERPDDAKEQNRLELQRCIMANQDPLTVVPPPVQRWLRRRVGPMDDPRQSIGTTAEGQPRPIDDRLSRRAILEQSVGRTPADETRADGLNRSVVDDMVPALVDGMQVERDELKRIVERRTRR